MLHEKLENLKKAYYSGVMKVREGDTWIEYNSAKQMRIAIQDLENEIAFAQNGSRPRGSRLVTTGKGF